MNTLDVINKWSHYSSDTLIDRVFQATEENAPPAVTTTERNAPPAVTIPFETKALKVYAIISKYLLDHENEMDASFAPGLHNLGDIIKTINANDIRGKFKENEALMALSRSTEDLVERLTTRTEFMKDNVAATTKLQAAYRGRKTRQNTVMPQQILPFLEKHLFRANLDGVTPLDVARGLCREINEMSAHPKKYKGKTIPIKRLTRAYPFKVGNEQSHILLNFDCRLEMAADGKSIKILIVPIGHDVVGSGTYKTVYRAQAFIIPLRTEAQDPASRSLFKPRQVNYSNRIVQDLSPKAEHIATVQSGQDKHQMLFERLHANPGVRLVSPSRNPLPTVEESPQSPEEEPYYQAAQQSAANRRVRSRSLMPEQEWYNTDLDKASTQGSLPNTMLKASSRTRVSMEARLEVLEDVASTLEAMHTETAYVHRDVKPANILIKMEENSPRGYLCDFDLTQFSGNSDLRAAYVFWDSNSEAGRVTPFCDCYGLVISLADVMIPGFHTDIVCTTKTKEDLNNYVRDKKAVADYIKLKADSDQALAGIDFGDTNSAAHAARLIDAYLLSNPSLDNEIKRRLNNFKKELFAVDKTFKLLEGVIAQDKKAVRLLNKPESAGFLAQLAAPCTTEAEAMAKTKASAEFFKDCISMTQLRGAIRSIRDSLA